MKKVITIVITLLMAITLLTGSLVVLAEDEETISIETETVLEDEVLSEEALFVDETVQLAEESAEETAAVSEDVFEEETSELVETASEEDQVQEIPDEESAEVTVPEETTVETEAQETTETEEISEVSETDADTIEEEVFDSEEVSEELAEEETLTEETAEEEVAEEAATEEATEEAAEEATEEAAEEVVEATAEETVTTEETTEAAEAEEETSAEELEEEAEEVEIEEDALYASAGDFVGGVYVIGILADGGLYAITNNSGTITATLIAADGSDATDAMKWTVAVDGGASIANGGVYLLYGDSTLMTRSSGRTPSNWSLSGSTITYAGKSDTYVAGGVSGGGFACGIGITPGVYTLIAVSGSSEDSSTDTSTDTSTDSSSSSSSSSTYSEIDATQGISTAYIEIVDPATGTTLNLDMGSFGTKTATVSGDSGSRTATTSKSTSIEVTAVGDGYTLRMQDPPDNWNYIYVKDGVLTADDKDNPGEATSFNHWHFDSEGHLYYLEGDTAYYLGADGTLSAAYDGKSVLFGGDTASSGGGGGGSSKSEIITNDANGPQITEEPVATAYMTEGSGYAAPVYSVTASLPEGSTASSITFTWYVNGEAQPAATVAATAGTAVTHTLRADSLTEKTYGVYPVYCEVSCVVPVTAEDGTVTDTTYTNTSLTVNFIVCKGVNSESFMTFSDVHETFSHIGYAINDIMAKDGDGLIPALIICTGDWANGHLMGGDETSENYATTQSTYIARLLAQSGGIDTVFVSGNHDNGTAAADATVDANLGAAEDFDGLGVIFDSEVAAENGESSKDLENLIVYGINYDKISTDTGYTYEKVIPELDAFLSELQKDYHGQLIVISAHAGLHQLDDWGGKNAYNLDKSNEMVQLLNKYSQAGMDIMFFFGHDHSKGESEFIVTPGEKLISTVSYTDQTTEENIIDFTYGHAGYITSNTGGKRRYTEVTWTDSEIQRVMSTMDETGAVTEEDVVVIPKKYSTYHIIEGAGSSWDGNPETSIIMRADGEFKDFRDVLVDGQLIELHKDYEADEGSTIITLKPEYLKTLSAGEHLLTVRFADGEASALFKVMDNGSSGGESSGEEAGPAPDGASPGGESSGEEAGPAPDGAAPEAKGQQPNIPKTGDENQAYLWILLIAASAIVMGAAVRRLTKSR